MDSMDILKAVLVALVGGIFGAWITAIRARWTAFSNDYSKRLEHVFIIIDRLAECSCIWWECIDPSDKLKANSNYILGLKIQLQTIIESIDKDYSGFNCTRVNKAYQNFVKACTGGDFPIRPASAGGESKAILKSAELLKAELFSVRRDDYSMKNIMKKKIPRVEKDV